MKQCIGITEYIDFDKHIQNIPAKIDTGADSSAVWASNIRIDEDRKLQFMLFDQNSPFFTGKVFKRTNYSVVLVRSASGHQTIRYRTHFTIKLGGRKIRVLFGLADRSKHKFPVLIGRRTLQGKFLIDPNNNQIKRQKIRATKLNSELIKNPYKFYLKYQAKDEK